jgi:hypothetical protein
MADGEVACTAELMIQLSETARTIAVGERFTPWVRLYGCGGRKRVTDTFTWRAEDPRVVAVDAVRGTVTGLAPGRTLVAVRRTAHGELDIILVSVRARAP